MAAAHLLVVDDTPEIAHIVRHLGKYAGQEVTACANVPEAWEHLQDSRRLPDLVLLDVNLPGTPGPELCRRLRTTPGLTGLPVALLAHWERSADVGAGLAAGADFLVCKDLLTRPDAWSARLREVLAWPHGRTAQRMLHWNETTGPPTPPEGVVQALNSALRQALPRQAAPEVLPVLAERSLQVVAWWHQRTGQGQALPPRGRPLTRAPDGWLLPAGPGLDSGRLARLGPPGAVVVFVVALAEQIACLVGRDAAGPLWGALAGAVPGLEEILTHR
jgi:CheY-like chemotaxis protein